MQTPERVDSLFVFEAGSINTIINDNHGTIYTNRSGQDSQPMELTDDDLRNNINQVLPLMKNSRHWFCILKVLMLHGQVLDGDFESGKRLIERLYPGGVNYKIDPADLSKLHTDSFKLPVASWSADDAPVKRGAEFTQYQNIALRMDELF